MLKNTVSILFLLGILLVSCSTGVDTYATVIDVDEAYQKYENGVFFLDVRTTEEWNEFHAPDTTLIPLDELPYRLNEIPQDGEVVVICQTGDRSQQGRDFLLNAGFEQVTSMTGGLISWYDAGYPLVIVP